MKKLKFKPTEKTVDFFNEFSIIDNLSVDEMLNRVLCYVSVQEPIDAAILLLWYAVASVDNLNDRQKSDVILSFISILVCCMVNSEFSINDALETITLTYKDITNDKRKNKDYGEMPIPEKICYDKKIKVQLASPAMKIKAYSKIRGITVEKAIEQKIEEMSPDNHNIARDVFFQRVIAVTIKQNQIQVCCTILILSALLLSYLKDAAFEQYIEILRNDCTENIEKSYKYRRIEELKEKIYRYN